MPKVSVIIPVYNVEKYLRECLDSVVNQTLKDIEIICIDDGSTDSSGKILDEYAANDERIKVIHKENGGYGKAMNVGIDNATGEYIGIVEPDDWIKCDMYEKLYIKGSELNADIIKGSYYCVTNNIPKIADGKFLIDLASKTKGVFRLEDYPEIIINFAAIWSAIYKRDWLIKNNIFFLEDIRSYEDTPFLNETYSKADSIYILPECLYFYRVDANNSSSNTIKKTIVNYVIQKGRCRDILIRNNCFNQDIKERYWQTAINGTKFWFGKPNNKFRHIFYNEMKKMYAKSFADAVELKYLNNDGKKFFNDVVKKSYYRYVTEKFLNKYIKKVFSIRNTSDKKHKLIIILGFKIKIRRKNFKKRYNKIPIINNQIVFDNFLGAGFGCNPKYIAKEIINQKLPYELIWLVKNENGNNVPKNIITANYHSEKALKYLASAKFIISNSRLNPLRDKGFTKKRGQYYIQTWHGCLAFKKIEKDIGHNKSYKNYLKAAKIDSKHIDYLVSPSRFDTKILRNCFYYSGEYLEIGYPRNDIFFYSDVEKNKIKNKVYSNLNILKNKKIVLYSPTFRDSKSLDVYKLNAESLIKTLNEKYNKDFVFVIRLHPLIQYKTNEISKLFPNAINASFYDDIQELLLAADILITDYSSCIFDFCLELKPAFVFATDINEYEQERGFYLDIHSMPFPVAQTEEELFDNISNFNESKYKIELSLFLEQRGSFDKGDASKKIVEIIKEKMKE